MTVSQVNVKPGIHPIGEPSHLLQVRAIGVLNGVIDPSGVITLTGDFKGKALTLGAEVYGLVQKLLKQGVGEALFVVWPRTKNGFVNSLEVIWVWKPSILDPNSGAQDDLPEGDNYFSIRGEVCHKVWCDENYGRSVAVQVCGQHFVTVDFVDSPYLSKGDFVSLEAILTEYGRLHAERVEKISIPDAAKARPSRTARAALFTSERTIRRRSSATA
jgi:hypothetical protein